MRTKLSCFQRTLCLLGVVDRSACLFRSFASLLLLDPLLLLDHLNVERVRQNRRDARELVQFYERSLSLTSTKFFGPGRWAEERENAMLKSNSRCPDSCIDENINTSPPKALTSSTSLTNRFRLATEGALLETQREQ